MESTDQELVAALLRRDEATTRDFFYRRCYPLFRSIYDNYHTDCDSCMEFISEIYLHIMQPDAEKNRCKLEDFRFQSTLFTWIKTVCLYYCYKRYERKQKMPLNQIVDNFDDDGVRIDTLDGSVNIDSASLDGHDVDVILRLMPNKRYSLLIRLRYIEEHTNEETAELMGMNMNTFYNKHKLAKEQFLKILNTEEKRHEWL